MIIDFFIMNNILYVTLRDNNVRRYSKSVYEISHRLRINSHDFIEEAKKYKGNLEYDFLVFNNRQDGHQFIEDYIESLLLMEKLVNKN